jgi:hypothetical protein
VEYLEDLKPGIPFDMLKIYVTADCKVVAKSIKIKVKLVGGYFMFRRTVNGCYYEGYVVDY